MNKTEKLKAIAELAQTIGVTGKRSEFAEMIVEAVEPNHVTLETFRAFMPVTQKNFGDTVIKRVRRGRYNVMTMVPNTAHLVSQTSWQDTHTWIFDRIIAGTRESMWNLQNNPSLVTVQGLISALKADLTDNIVGRVFQLLASTWNASDTPSNYISNSGNVTKSNLDAMIENVLEKSGNVRAIVGARRSLLPIYEFTGFAQFTPTGGSATGFAVPEVIVEYMRTNRVSSYKGYPLIELPQVLNTRIPGLEAKMIPEDRILVIGDNAGEVVLYGPTEQQEHMDTTIQPADWQVHVWQQFGLMVDNVEGIGVIKLS